MMKIQPIQFTDAPVLAVTLNVETGNVTDISVDCHWFLYDADGQYIDDGISTATDEDFVQIMADGAHAFVFIAQQKGLTIVNE
jgi:hypothetical protein